MTIHILQVNDNDDVDENDGDVGDDDEIVLVYGQGWRSI